MSFNSKIYWEDRYSKNGNSGLGSHDILQTKFKSDYINNLIINNNLKTVVELGSGDGNQLKMFKGYDSYTGYDVSKTIIEKCQLEFANDISKKFTNNIQDIKEKYDLALSLDVIYHLVEENVYYEYLEKLFSCSDIICIYTTNINDNDWSGHMVLRSLDDYVDKHQKDFTLIDKSMWVANYINPKYKLGFYTYKKK
jgi:cyclopropane fatty-acyl-phospholipid synthase-like methyltransferase